MLLNEYRQPKRALGRPYYNISSLTNETLTRVHSDYEAANDEHLKRLRRLPQGHQQCGYYCKTVIDQQGSSSVGMKTIWKRNSLVRDNFGTDLTANIFLKKTLTVAHTDWTKITWSASVCSLDFSSGHVEEDSLVLVSLFQMLACTLRYSVLQKHIKSLQNESSLSCQDSSPADRPTSAPWVAGRGCGMDECVGFVF